MGAPSPLCPLLSQLCPARPRTSHPPPRWEFGVSPTADGETEAHNNAAPPNALPPLHHKSLPSVGRPPFRKDLLGGGGWVEGWDTTRARRQRCASINREAIAAMGWGHRASLPPIPALCTTPRSAESAAWRIPRRGVRTRVLCK